MIITSHETHLTATLSLPFISI